MLYGRQAGAQPQSPARAVLGFRPMRLPASCLALLAALAGCGSEDNTVISGLPGVIISPVRSSISTRATFTDANGSSIRNGSSS